MPSTQARELSSARASQRCRLADPRERKRPPADRSASDLRPAQRSALRNGHDTQGEERPAAHSGRIVAEEERTDARKRAYGSSFERCWPCPNVTQGCTLIDIRRRHHDRGLSPTFRPFAPCRLARHGVSWRTNWLPLLQKTVDHASQRRQLQVDTWPLDIVRPVG